MIVAIMDEVRARNAGFRMRTRPELIHDVTVACASLGDLAHAGIGVTELAGVARTLERMRRLLVDLRTGGSNNAA